MANPLKVALIQNCAERDMAPSIAALEPLIRAAAKDKAQFILLPEMAAMLEPDSAQVLAKAKSEAEDPALKSFRALARDTQTWVLVGSLLFKEPGKARMVNRSLLVDPSGAITARYDKLHLFDVDVGDGQFYKESATVEPGERAVLGATPWGLMGFSICYDLRFAYLYRALAQAGAAMLAVPAAFTYATGKAHWHILARARAIETGSFVLAPNQCGTHAEGRKTWGHSLIVDPWGEMLADGGEDVGVVSATIDLDAVAEARRKIPALKHDRSFPAPGRPVLQTKAGE
jgi:deaminated glutathione amidase